MIRVCDLYRNFCCVVVLFLAAVDCTGHGVPGAIVSVICSNALNRSVREYKLSKPSEILNQTLEIVLDKFGSPAPTTS